eukprot:15431892-Alexandrium_andersonii.AAC.1
MSIHMFPNAISRNSMSEFGVARAFGHATSAAPPPQDSSPRSAGAGASAAAAAVKPELQEATPTKLADVKTVRMGAAIKVKDELTKEVTALKAAVLAGLAEMEAGSAEEGDELEQMKTLDERLVIAAAFLGVKPELQQPSGKSESECKTAWRLDDLGTTISPGKMPFPLTFLDGATCLLLSHTIALGRGHIRSQSEWGWRGGWGTQL